MPWAGRDSTQGVYWLELERIGTPWATNRTKVTMVFPALELLLKVKPAFPHADQVQADSFSDCGSGEWAAASSAVKH